MVMDEARLKEKQRQILDAYDNEPAYTKEIIERMLSDPFDDLDCNNCVGYLLCSQINDTILKDKMPIYRKLSAAYMSS